MLCREHVDLPSAQIAANKNLAKLICALQLHDQKSFCHAHSSQKHASWKGLHELLASEICSERSRFLYDRVQSTRTARISRSMSLLCISRATRQLVQLKKSSCEALPWLTAHAPFTGLGSWLEDRLDAPACLCVVRYVGL